ncbi:MAG: hypothetical protein DI630_16775 [Gordonia sp. (in: high G+C Gram-positive bacteria)]|nr:MAG: hypothetical protein DI630_16775 [Gordonia sp. (in: high G+C Gram-positive bacteria)]
MSTPTHEVAPLDVASLDEAPQCECVCHNETRPANLRIRYHAPRDNDLYACDNISALLCGECFDTLRQSIERQLAAACRHGRQCGGCGKQLRQLGDIILAVITL